MGRFMNDSCDHALGFGPVEHLIDLIGRTAAVAGAANRLIAGEVIHGHAIGFQAVVGDDVFGAVAELSARRSECRT